MIITILTLFPEVFTNIFQTSIIGRAQKKGFVTIRIVNIRDFATDKHKSVDDRPYGGGEGMILRIDILFRAISEVKLQSPQTVNHEKKTITERVILLDPRAKLYTQAKARYYSHLDHLILVCGHYEGMDARIEHFIDESISIGRYILTGGEIPAMVIADSIVRLIPRVLSKQNATLHESYTLAGQREAPSYTRPPEFQGLKVPEVLLSGNHKIIQEWRREHTSTTAPQEKK